MKRENIEARVKGLLPAPVRRGVRGAFYRFDGLSRARARSAGESRPIPPQLLRERIGATSIESYFNAGEGWGQAIEDALSSVDRDLSQFQAVLDFGCGAGKVLQYLAPRYPDIHWSGCDLHAPSVEWVGSNLPVETEVNGYEPPAPFAADSFDLVYLCSVFTHLGREVQSRWLDELIRITKPGGILAISIQGETSGYVEDQEDAPAAARIESEGFVFEPYETDGASYGDFAGTTEEYGLAYQSHRWTREEWADRVEVVTIIPRGLGGRQDLAIATVPA